jgi:uncharacterized Fe-S cluster protein YjdI
MAGAGEEAIMAEGEVIREYSKDGVTVVWQPSMCIHSAKCALELGSVFNPQARPRVNIDGAPVERIVEQVKRCPSGALSYRNA